MSRGHGALERYIKDRVDTDHYIHLYLAARNFYELPDGVALEKRHKVSVLRAAKSLASRYGYYIAEAVSVQTLETGVRIHWRGMHISTEPLKSGRITQSELAKETRVHQSTVSRDLRSFYVDAEGYRHETKKLLGMTCTVLFPTFNKEY